MGYGDDIMSTAEVRGVHERTGLRVSLGDGRIPYWSPVFAGNPRIVPLDEREAPRAWVGDYVGNRPYIDYERSTNARQIVREDFVARAGELYLSEEELLRASAMVRDFEHFVVVEPNVKGSFSGVNKAWEWSRWIGLTRQTDFQWLQVSAPGKPTLPGVCRAPVHTIREALAVVALSSGIVTTEGALHHAAAALDIPAVVLWGGRTNPRMLGYPQHENLYVERPGSPCGMNRECAHCRACMSAIAPDDVLAALLKTA